MRFLGPSIMFEGLLTVKFLTSKDCFCALSPNNYKHLHSNVVKLIYNDEVTHVSVAPLGAINDQCIGVSSLFAKVLQLEENSLVAISEISKPPTVKTAEIRALDANDHYVLESLAESVQSTLLEQIRVLTEGQKFVIWIGKNIHVSVVVGIVNPISPGQIDNLTEIVIKPPENELKTVTNNNKVQTKAPKNAPFDFLTDYMNRPEKLNLRIVPSSDLHQKIGNLLQPFNVFVTRKAFSSPNTTTTLRIFRMKLLTSENEKQVYVRLYVLEDVIPDLKLNRLCSENIFISVALLEYFNCCIGTRVVLEAYEEQTDNPRELEICTKKNYSVDIIQLFQQYLADNCNNQEFLLNPNIVINITNNLRCFLRFQPPQVNFCLVNPEFVRNCKLIFVNEALPDRETPEKSEFPMSKYTTSISNYQDIIDKSLFLFSFNTTIFQKMHNVLITGKSGTGKTTILEMVACLLTSFPEFIYTTKVSCKSLKGKTVESLHKYLTNTFLDLIHLQPSVLILDDLHVLCESVNEGEAAAPQAVYFNRVSEMLEGLFQKFCEHNAVGILATAESTTNLHKNIYSTRGNHLFKNVYDIKELTRNDRKSLLEFLFRDYKLEDLDLSRCSEKTESFVMQDMVDLVNKTLFESYQEDPSQVTMKLTSDHFNIALKTVTETSLSSINLQPPGEKNLDDIGGLTTAKKILVETMLWPAKYPELFNDAPLRLPSGLLLYGPPGTGKTLLAGAAAKHCGLRLISIKGPELLSKYIGASEQAVRDVFQRAQSAKPCVLFFDEFDSLAPRRGHDNTGVTDRVVNQLLTQLDGIESLSGVFVLTATSRPDLLDPALLRPGRLDIHIRCSLPDETSRHDILKVLSKNLQFSSEVNLLEIAVASEGFSGADLQAVLYTAQLESVKGLLENEVNTEEFHQEIRQEMLLEALKNTRPSLTRAEQKKYEMIYRKFEGGGGGGFTPGSRATLA